ncbi:3-phosphoshikimate 1-carboxyvinyltransferase [Candidatus Micrarchaeota archaeon]|nr:3-phosphoshikimate 1-carboxyvinyltransferase [Candidatus Micrarchaeota archaeon]MBU1166301.1 3-phosphoshikimate 1-carboxyvinyltransferase [Candidatus Micrarchaeota archaeon]MBU1886389.1 3-phosphoshikimate 1-carboxyvinyltransferase [Candidatus Micrarchaeota archaeon]
MKHIEPSGINGSITAPVSKSMMQRAMIIASLAIGKTRLWHPSIKDGVCEDISTTDCAIQDIGAKTLRSYIDGYIQIIGTREPDYFQMDCDESGTCMRMITPVVSLYPNKVRLDAEGSLKKRPMKMMEVPLRELGAECSTDNGFPPIIVKGPIHGGKLKIDGSKTSQFLSGLLIALPLCKENSEIKVSNLKSRRYVEITLEVMKEFGVEIEHNAELGLFKIKGGQKYKPKKKLKINGDWSGAAFMLVAGAIAGRVNISGIKKDSQPDSVVLDILKKVGANVNTGNGIVEVTKKQLNAFEFDATNCPDLFPPLAVLACNCKGKSVIHGTERLKHKESDRAAALISELGNMGADIKVVGNRMEIVGKKLQGGVIVDPHNDHRIAMACAVVALTSEKGVQINDEKCVSKSYPKFFEDLEGLMVKI